MLGIGDSGSIGFAGFLLNFSELEPMRKDRGWDLA